MSPTTSLHWAASNGKLSVVDAILSDLRDQARGDADAAPPQTPSLNLSGGILDGSLDLRSSIAEIPPGLDPPETPDDCDAYGETPLHLAALGGHDGVVARLLRADSGASPFAEDLFERTPLWFAAKKGHAKVVGYLLRAAVMGIQTRFETEAAAEEPAKSNESGTSEQASPHRDEKKSSVSGLLVDHVIHKSTDGHSALTKATHYGHEEVVAQLLDAIAGATKVSVQRAVQDSTRTGDTLLHICAARGHVEIAEMLVNLYGADVNALGAIELTPLHVAVRYNHAGVVKFLLRAHADTWAQSGDEHRATPLDDAVRLKRSQCVRLIEKTRKRLMLLALREQPLGQWTTADVVKWLTLLDFGQYANQFFENDIDGAHIGSLNEKKLKVELGIESFAHRQDIAKRIRALPQKCACEPAELGATADMPETSLPRVNRGKLSRSEQLQYAKEQRLLRRSSDVGSVSRSLPGAQSGVDGKSYAEIPFEKLEMGELLGKGFFGEVHKAMWGGTAVAVKVIYRETFGPQQGAVTTGLTTDDLDSELRILSKLRHPNVLMFLGSSTHPTEGHRLLVTEYLPNGSLHQLIHYSGDSLDRQPSLRIRIARDVCQGMFYLHSERVLHRDLSPKNLLLDSNLACKVCDFGLSRITSADSSNAGTMGSQCVVSMSLGCLPYQAPEVFRGEKYAPAADVFSFGMVCFELISGLEPHAHNDPMRFANLVAYQEFRPSVPDKFMETFWQELLEKSWAGDAALRPSFAELLETIEEAQGRTTQPLHAPVVQRRAVAELPRDLAGEYV